MSLQITQNDVIARCLVVVLDATNLDWDDTAEATLIALMACLGSQWQPIVYLKHGLPCLQIDVCSKEGWRNWCSKQDCSELLYIQSPTPWG
ncbi:hypothetical protein SCARD494_12561 [Seiridium cardinale]